jgi:hypothetical protein
VRIKTPHSYNYSQLPPIAHASSHAYDQHQMSMKFRRSLNRAHQMNESQPFRCQPEYYLNHHSHDLHQQFQDELTYDSRWWYRSGKSVYAPKPLQYTEYHYKPPKWYESTANRGSMMVRNQNSVLSAGKYTDCRYQMYRQLQTMPRSIEWAVHNQH